jgi:uncharacterized protein (DUF58 family)
VIVGVSLLSILSAAIYGPRSLNAVVIPAVVALVGAYVQVSRMDAPETVRETPRDDHVDRSGTVELSFVEEAGSGTVEKPLSRPFVGLVEETVGEGLSATGTTVETVVGVEPITYDITYETRGEHVLGPAEVTARDVLGLVERDFECRGTDTVLAYPRLHAIAPWAQRDLRALHETGIHEERSEFDRLREYTQGDSLRDIHWKSTAKRDELIVKEFAAEAETEAVTLAAGAEVGGADGMAEATASIAMTLIEDGIPIEVNFPDGSVSAGPERGSRLRLLERLALVGPGRVRVEDADITVFGKADETTVSLGQFDTPFDDLVADRPPAYRTTTGAAVTPDGAGGAAASNRRPTEGNRTDGHDDGRRTDGHAEEREVNA